MGAIWVEDATIVRYAEQSQLPGIRAPVPQELQTPSRPFLLFQYDAARNKAAWEKLIPGVPPATYRSEATVVGQFETIGPQVPEPMKGGFGHLNAFPHELILVDVLSSTVLDFPSSPPRRVKPYALSTWSNLTCRAKGRFQDREYCASPVVDQIVADGKSAVPVLISQITDTRWIAEPVYDFWPRIRAGELANFILADLFVDDTWQKSTMPPLFPEKPCHESGWDCWAKFRKTHSLKDIQSHWEAFWELNKERIYWDDKARCFRLADRKTEK